MSARLNYYFRQKVTEAELDLGFALLEAADRNQNIDASFIGAMSNGVVSQRSGGANLTVDISGSAVVYNKLGERITWSSLQNVDVSVDENAVTTAVSSGGNSKIISVFAKFKRSLSDPRTDGNSATVYFQEDESFEFVVRQSSEAVSPTPPSLDATHILLADITRTFGQTTIVNANIGITRREDVFKSSGSPRSIQRGLAKDAFADILSYYNNHVTGVADSHSGAAIAYAGGAAWFDGTTNPATTVEAQLDKIITDLNPTTGALKIGTAATGNWFDATPVAAGSIQSSLNGIVSALAATTGAAKVGTVVTGAWFDATTVAAGSVQSQITGIVSALAGTAGAGKIGTVVTGAWFDATTVAAGSVQSQISGIVSALAGTTGAAKVGTVATGAWFDATTVAAGSVQSQITGIVSALAGTAGGGKIGIVTNFGSYKDATTQAGTTVQAGLAGIVNTLGASTAGVKVGTAATGAWFDATTVAAGSVQSSLNGIVSALAGTTGAAKVGTVVTGAWADTTTVAAGSVQSQITGIVSALASTTDGFSKMGAPAFAAPFTGAPYTTSAGQFGTQFTAVLNALNNPFRVRTITTNLTIGAINADAIIVINFSSSANITLPAPSTVVGRQIVLIDKGVTPLSSTNVATLVRNGSEKINNVAASYALTAGNGRWDVYTDGTDWYVN